MNHINLLKFVGDMLEKSISKSASDEFLNDPFVKVSYNMPTSIQRIIINRYFHTLLFKWRSSSSTPIFHIIPMLCDDGDDDNWAKLFVQFVLPFLRENYVMGLPIQVEK